MVEVLPDVAPGLIERLLGLLLRVKSVPVLGASQKPLQPARNGSAARNSPAHLVCPIPAPWGLALSPDSTVLISNPPVPMPIHWYRFPAWSEARGLHGANRPWPAYTSRVSPGGQSCRARARSRLQN
jgi:hypothetical protein